MFVQRCFGKLGLIGFCVIISSSAPAFADGDSPRTDSHANTKLAPWFGPYESAWRLFGGAQVGYGGVSGNEFSQAPAGQQIEVDAVLSYQTPNWVLDGGTGWLYSRISGVDSLNRNLDIRTRAGILDLSPRYRLTERWQLGPVLDLACGTDTSFAPTVGEGSIVNAFAGGRVVYEMPIGGYPVRFLAQSTTDLTIPGRQAVMGMIGAQFGIPFGVEKSQVTDVVSLSQAAPALDSDGSGEVRVVLDPQKVFFGTNSNRIRPEVKELLTDIGAYLGRADAAWGSVLISGHADRRGRFQYNLKLSRRRAKAVLDALAEGGARAEKMKSEGFSYLKPSDPRNSPEGWAHNRRVELVFLTVARPQELRSQFVRLEKLTRTQN